MIEFDQYGYIYPYELTQAELDEVFSVFAFNEKRKKLFDTLVAFRGAVDKIVDCAYIQWVDGSFVSKKVSPRDIDVVTFIGHQVYSSKEKELKAIRRSFLNVDAYFVKDYPEGHPKRFVTVYDQKEWYFLFSSDRQRRPKGFLQI